MDSKNLETLVDTRKLEIIQDLQKYLKSSQVQERAVDWKLTDLKARSSEIVTEGIIRMILEWAEKDDGVLKKAIADVEKGIAKCFGSIHEMKLDCHPECTVEGSIEPLDFEFLAKSVASTTFATRTHLPLSGLPFRLTFYLSQFMKELIYRLQNKKSKLNKLTIKTLEKVSDNEWTKNVISTIFELPFKNRIKQFRNTMQCEIASKNKLVEQLSADVQESATDHESTLGSLSHELNKIFNAFGENRSETLQ